MSFSKTGSSPNIIVTVTDQDWTMQDLFTWDPTILTKTVYTDMTVWVLDISVIEMDCTTGPFSFTSQDEIIINKNNSAGTFIPKVGTTYQSTWQFGTKDTDILGTANGSCLIGYRVNGGSLETKCKQLYYGSFLKDSSGLAANHGLDSEAGNTNFDSYIQFSGSTPANWTNNIFTRNLVQILTAATIFDLNVAADVSVAPLVLSTTAVINRLSRSSGAISPLYACLFSNLTFRNPQWDATIAQVGPPQATGTTKIEYTVNMKVTKTESSATPPVVRPISGAKVYIWKIDETSGVKTAESGSPFTTDASGDVAPNLLARYQIVGSAATSYTHLIRVINPGFKRKEFLVQIRSEKVTTLELELEDTDIDMETYT